MRTAGAALGFFAAAMAALGILGFITGDFASVWQPVPRWVPGRTMLAFGCAAISFAGGVGLLWSRTAAAAARILFLYLLLWLLLLRVPAVLVAPLSEVSWSGCGENAVLVAAAWVLLARSATPPYGSYLIFPTGGRGIRLAAIAYGLALFPCGLAHIVYLTDTAQLVPAWLPWHTAWAWLTGAAYLAAGAAIVCRICDRAAALLSAAMMGAFTLLVWVPAVTRTPADRFSWTALLISSSLAAGACVVADAYRIRPDG